VGGQVAGPPSPEEVLESFEIPSPFGYGRAKWIAELLVDTAARHLKELVPSTILRLGQVAGHVYYPGLWNPKEWFPSMVFSSFHLGQVPNSLGPFDNIDFVPVDILADVVADLVTSTATQSPGVTTVFNIRNPHLVSWSKLLPAISKATTAEGKPPLQVVPPATWLSTLQGSVKASNDNGDAAVRNPAIKLVEYFDRLWGAGSNRGQAPSHRMVIDGAFAASPSLRKLEPVGLGWMEKWVREWIGTQATSRSVE
jgi:thioester reductase-like protein